MYRYLIQGLLLGLAYVAPIGMQNLYVINTAIKGDRMRAYQVAFVTIFFDITLALACFFGIGLLIKNIPVLKSAILLVGSILVIYIGFGLIRNSSEVTDDVEADKSLIKIIITCFIVTWLNPQALIDGSLLLGGYRSAVPADMAGYFIFGFSGASFIWFIFISTLSLSLQEKLNSGVIKRINVVCGLLLIFFGVKLGYSFLGLI